MNPHEIDLPSLLTRVRTLEKANRLTRVSLLLVIIIAVGVVLLQGKSSSVAAPEPAASKEKNIEAEKFILRDADGKQRAVLAVSEKGPSLSFFDENEKRRSSYAVSKEGSHLFMESPDGVHKLELAVADTFSVLNMMDANTSRVKLGIGRPPMLVLWDEKGRPIFEIVRDGRSLTLYDSEGKAVFSKP
jgi:hypothetical protein